MIDLGYGTTRTYLGHTHLEEATLCPRYDGKLVPLSERQLRAFALALVHGNREAGYRMGIAEQTVKNLLTRVYRRLGVFGKWEAADMLGWIRVPPELLDAPPTTGGRSVAGLGRGLSGDVSPPASTGGNR